MNNSPNENNFGNVVFDINAINNEIINILSTSIGDRIFEPTFGSNINSIVFEPQDEITAYYLLLELQDSLGKWMPRIVFLANASSVLPSNAGNREFLVTIAYQVVGLTNQQAQLQVLLGP